MQILGEMHVRHMPLSYKFKMMLGPAYASDAGEETSSSEEENSEEEIASDFGSEGEGSQMLD